LARTLARLRIAGRVAAPVARLATGWGGYPFAGRVSHPLDDIPNFMNSSHDSLLSDQNFLVALNCLCSALARIPPCILAVQGNTMPVISMFYGILVRMYLIDNKQHNLPHIHVMVCRV
jgi:hypothetical protein